MNIRKRYTVSNYVDDLQRKGKLSFSLESVFDTFKSVDKRAVRNSLSRLSGKGRIASVWNGYYVIVPLQYSNMGTLPAVMYIDQLMKYLGRAYYISLLSAATFYGASHQQPQVFFVIISPPQLRSSLKKGIRIVFNQRAKFPSEFLITKNSQTGTIKISSAELTAIDLILFEKEIGGINRAASIINELAEVMDLSTLPKLFFEYAPLSIFQRLGYLLEVELGYTALADALYNKMQEFGLVCKRTRLSISKPASENYNKRWNIVVNTQIEIDE